MPVSVDASGLSVLATSLGVASGRVGAGVATALRKTAFDIQADAQSLAPVDTGTLRSSISTTLTGSGSFASMTAEIGPTVEYGDFVERGTSRMAPQPYMAPAFDRRASGFEQAVLQLAAGDIGG